MIVAALAALSLYARQDSAPIAIAPGTYTFEQLAARLSSPEAAITAAKPLRSRVVYLKVAPKSRAELLSILSATSGVALTPLGASGREFRLAPEEAILRGEARDRAAVVAYLRAMAGEIYDEALTLRREGASQEVEQAKAATELETRGLPSDTAGKIRAADRLAEADVHLYASLALLDLSYPHNRIGLLLGFNGISAVNGESFARAPEPRMWTRAQAMQVAERAGEPLEPIANYNGLLLAWKLTRRPGQIFLMPGGAWVNNTSLPESVTAISAGALPSDGQARAGIDLVNALYVGVPGSRRWSPLVSPESQARYAALGTSTNEIFATEAGQALATALTKPNDVEDVETFSMRFEGWAKEKGQEVAYELCPVTDSPEFGDTTGPLGGFTNWRLTKVAGVTVAVNVLDFIDRTIPMNVPALLPLLAPPKRESTLLSEEETRAYYAAAGFAPDLPEGLPWVYRSIPVNALRAGGAAFLAYESLRSRREVAAMLSGGKIEVPVASLDERTIRSMTGALAMDALSTIRFYGNADERLRGYSLFITVKIAGETREVTVDLKPTRATNSRFGYASGLESRTRFRRSRS